ncbi:MAG: tail fiber assembly protein [Methyloceanibacter sp.]|uniref:tail fiber assembly protein n=1 Tax=Methyloceanibacter sp. TaxID=1965321 RepID=UPI003D6C9E36
MTTIYLFDPETGEFAGSMQAKRDRFGTELLPGPHHASRTLDAPPEFAPGHVVCRKDGVWVQVEDHRGETVYATADGTEREIKDLGALPDDVTAAKPGVHDTWDERRGAWAEDAERRATSERQALIEAARAAAAERVATSPSGEISAEDLAVAVGLREPAL